MSKHQMTTEELWQWMLDMRGIEQGDACKDCGGAGIKAYGDTSTWHRGIGGQMITNDVCDKCWGSGSKTRAWRSARKIESDERASADLRSQLAAAQKRIKELETQIVDYTAWLIEWPEDDNMPVRWWHPINGWMRDANFALQFSRKADAVAYKYSQRLNQGIATEHKFCARAALKQQEQG
jgi:hypothetical protein